MLTSADHVCGARRLPFGAVSHVFCGWSIRINNWCCSVCILKVLPVLFCVCWFSVSLRRSLRRRHDVNPIFYVHDSQHRIFSFFFCRTLLCLFRERVSNVTTMLWQCLPLFIWVVVPWLWSLIFSGSASHTMRAFEIKGIAFLTED